MLVWTTNVEQPRHNVLNWRRFSENTSHDVVTGDDIA